MPKQILLTGVTGFLGSFLAHAFLQQGYIVHGLKRLNSSLYRLQDVVDKDQLKLINSEDVNWKFFFLQNKIEAIVHTATMYGRLGEGMDIMEKVNTQLPSLLWGFAGEYKVPLFINTDTFMPADTSMEDRYYNYCRTKKAFLEYAKHKPQGGTKFVNLVVYHMYGPNDNPTKFLPVMISKLISNESEINLTPGDQQRDFIFINDVVNAFVKTLHEAENLPHFSEFQIGTGTLRSIRELLELAKQYTGSASKLLWGALPYPPGEVMFSSADTSANGALSWHADTVLEAGLKITCEFYKHHHIVI